MPGYLKTAALVISGGAIVGAGAAEFIPARALAPLLAPAAVPDFARVPCRQQLWLNADRGCQTWTVPHSEVRRVLLIEPPVAEPAPESHVATASTQAPRTVGNVNSKVRSADSARSPSASHAGPARPRAVEGRRAITSRSSMESSL